MLFFKQTRPQTSLRTVAIEKAFTDEIIPKMSIVRSVDHTGGRKRDTFLCFSKYSFFALSFTNNFY